MTQIAHQLRTLLANMENYLVLLEEEGISVEDNGIGISQDEENRIFKLYYRGKNTTGYEGFGIGLYITNEIARKHDGFMRVCRKENGLIMSIFLPKTVTL